MSNIARTASTMANSTRLALYYHPYSFYSQKVVMVLHEKQIEFDPIIIDIIRGEQFNATYLKINPKAEVPVLQDAGKIIPDSTRIIDYLEDNFSNGAHPSLLPKSNETKAKVLQMRSIIDSLPAGVISMGSFFHPEFCETPKLPFIRPVRKMLKSAEIKTSEKLRTNAELNPDERGILLKKAELQEKKHSIIENKEEYIKILNAVEAVLDAVEKELSTRGHEEMWLCCQDFTLADVSLTILLVRLDALGMEKFFWSDGKRCNVEKYYNRVQEKPSFKKTIPGFDVHIKMFIHSQSKIAMGVSMISIVGFITGIVYVIKKGLL